MIHFVMCGKMYLIYTENEYYLCQFWGVPCTQGWPSEKWHLGQSKFKLHLPTPYHSVQHYPFWLLKPLYHHNSNKDDNDGDSDGGGGEENDNLTALCCIFRFVEPYMPFLVPWHVHNEKTDDREHRRWQQGARWCTTMGFYHNSRFYI